MALFDGKFNNIKPVSRIFALAPTILEILSFEILNIEKMIKITKYNLDNGVVRRWIKNLLKP